MNANASVLRFSSDFSTDLAAADPEIAEAIRNELGRQQQEIELIASENIVSKAVLEAQGSIMTNKYAEGYPGKRYYGGCEFVDVAETLAIERAKTLFGVAFGNVQPNSGSQANQGVYQALLQPGDTILGMSLDGGGHLTHGAKPNQSGKWSNAIQYGVRLQDGRVDMDQVRDLALDDNGELGERPVLASGCSARDDRSPQTIGGHPERVCRVSHADGAEDCACRRRQGRGVRSPPDRRTQRL